MTRRAASAGLTLVELLVAVALLSVVAAAAIGMIGGGLSVWQRARDHAVFDQSLLLALESVRRDLHNVQPFRMIAFEGTYDTLSFPVLLEAGTIEETRVREVGQRGYYLDSGRRILCRGQVPYRRARATSWKTTCQPLATGVERVRFWYYAPDPTTGRYAWVGVWSSPEPPLAVKIELGTRRSPGEPATTRTLIVHLPIATVR